MSLQRLNNDIDVIWIETFGAKHLLQLFPKLNKVWQLLQSIAQEILYQFQKITKLKELKYTAHLKSRLEKPRYKLDERNCLYLYS